MKATAKTCPNPNVCDLVYYPVVEFWVIHQDVLDAIGNICQKTKLCCIKPKDAHNKNNIGIDSNGRNFPVSDQR